MDIHLSPATAGHILALNRKLYGLEKPKGPSREKREMPFSSHKRHEFWTANVRYVDHGKRSVHPPKPNKMLTASTPWQAATTRKDRPGNIAATNWPGKTHRWISSETNAREAAG